MPAAGRQLAEDPRLCKILQWMGLATFIARFDKCAACLSEREPFGLNKLPCRVVVGEGPGWRLAVSLPSGSRCHSLGSTSRTAPRAAYASRQALTCGAGRGSVGGVRGAAGRGGLPSRPRKYSLSSDIMPGLT
jgi:hypothetical protein